MFPREAFEPRDFFHFEIVHQSKKPGSRARVGRIHTPHGVIDTPTFVAVGTNGTLKAVDHDDAQAAGVQLMFMNTYHLLLQPGPEIVQAAGGLHKFINRQQPIITDSGGFQVFSLAHGSVHDEINMKSRNQKRQSNDPTVLKVTEEGAHFRSYRDGRKILLTPESSVQTQKALGADMIIPLDELHPYHISREDLLKSLHLSHRWEARSLMEHLSNIKQQAMYCVLHGGCDRDLRKKSIDYLTSLPFDGIAIGGSLGKDREELIKLLGFIMPALDEALPRPKPNHLLGIADQPSILESVPLGVDSFDSCFPTRLGRHGTILTDSPDHPSGRIHIKQGKYATRFEPIDEHSPIKGHSLAYLHHLYKSKEPIAWNLMTLHNIHHMTRVMRGIRKKILQDEI
jgi:queuine tRNA-ribosyltransferase